MSGLASLHVYKGEGLAVSCRCLLRFLQLFAAQLVSTETALLLTLVRAILDGLEERVPTVLANTVCIACISNSTYMQISMSVSATMVAVLRTVSTLLVAITVPAMLDIPWLLMGMAVMVSRTS